MMHWIQEYIQSIWSITAEMAPWLLLGFLFAGLMYVYIPQQKIQQWLGKSSLSSIVKAVLIGVPLPLCSCGVIPTAISLYKNGASKSSTNAFLISTPQTGVDSIFTTYAMLGLPFAIIRPIAAFLSGIFGGLLTKWGLKEKSVDSWKSPSSNQEYNRPKTFKDALQYGFVNMVDDIAKWLVIGILLAGAIDVFIPKDTLAFITDNPFKEFAVMLALSIPLYVCATGSIPIAVVLILKGVSPGAAFLFLMAGPATNVATYTVLQNVLGKKSTWIYLISIILSALFFGYVINTFLPSYWFIISDEVAHAMHHTHWVNVVSGIILILLLLKSLLPKPKTNVSVNNQLDMEFKVKGMTCNHCKANVERNLENLGGVQKVEVNLDNGTVNIEGNPDKNEVKKTIESIGYEYCDI